MFRLMIVDDEAPFCGSLARMIAELQTDFEVVGEAYDGEEALDGLDRWEPDAVITDIRMQVMDGLQFLEEARRRRPDLLTVVLSAYPEFEYAQKAIRLQTESYLVKPVKEEELRDLLARLAERCRHLEERKEQAALQALMSRSAAASPAIPESMRQASYRLYLACAGSYCKTAADPLHPGVGFWDADAEWLRRLASELPAAVKLWKMDGAFDNEKLLLAGLPAQSEDKAILLEHELRSQLLHREVPVTIVASPPMDDLSRLAESRRELRTRLVKEAVFGRSTWAGEAAGETGRADGTAGSERDWIEAVQSGDKNVWLPRLRQLFAAGRESGWRQFALERLLVNTAGHLERQAARHDMPIAHELAVELETLVSASTGYEELLQNVAGQLEMIEAAEPSRGRTQPDYREQLVEDVQRYLEDQFDQPLKLQDLSRRFGLVPGYLSSLFRKGTGMTPGEYLTDLRVREAKRLLDERPGMLLKEVAEAVGFQDPLYFSKVFKKITGFAPSHYTK